MKITLADKFIAWLTLFSGLSISAVAVYYSVAGLISIFAAAVIPIAIMGIVLELSKLVATVWLKQNWFIAPRFIKAYLLVAVAILMIITSMGIFGYLSKAHMDQSLVSGDVQSKIAIYDEKIKTARENIEANRKQLKQMDEAVDQVMARSTDEKGADKSNAIRRSQQRDRVALAKDIESQQKLIAVLNDESAPIRAEVRKVEAEVGPIKYIAALLYGDNPDTNLLERAVRWVIIIIVIVFDPLAVILLLASQYSFQWFRKQEDTEEHPPYYVADVGEKPTEEELKTNDDGDNDPCPKCGTPMLDAPGIGLYCPNKKCDILDNHKGYLDEEQAKKAVWPFPTQEEINSKQEIKFKDAGEHPKDTFEYEKEDDPTPHHPDTHPYLRQGFKYPEGWQHENLSSEIEEVDSATLKNIERKLNIIHTIHEEQTPEEILEEGLKAAKKQWKSKNPADTIKRQETLYEAGLIEQLPWEIVEEFDSKKEEELKKKSTYMIKEQDQQIKKTKE